MLKFDEKTKLLSAYCIPYQKQDYKYHLDDMKVSYNKYLSSSNGLHSDLIELIDALNIAASGKNVDGEANSQIFELKSFRLTNDSGVLGITSPSIGVWVTLWSKFQKQFLPEDEWWQGNTDKGIEIIPGTTIRGGCKTYTLGTFGDAYSIVDADDDVPGKQRFLHSLITGTCCKYSPEDLVLQVIQLERREPIDCSSNVQYLTGLPHESSLTFGEGLGRDAIKQLKLYADRIYKKLQDRGYTDVESYNTHMRGESHDLDIIPRRLVVIDDADVLFSCRDIDTIHDIHCLMEIGRKVGINIIYGFNNYCHIVMNELENAIFEQCTLRFTLCNRQNVECCGIEDEASLLCTVPEMWFQDVDIVSKRMWMMPGAYSKF